MKIRDTDDLLGKKLLELLDIAEAQWGKWKHDLKDDVILFESDAAAEQYAAAMAQISKIADEQAEAQQTLFRIQAELRGEPGWPTTGAFKDISPKSASTPSSSFLATTCGRS